MCWELFNGVCVKDLLLWNTMAVGISQNGKVREAIPVTEAEASYKNILAGIIKRKKNKHEWDEQTSSWKRT
ncbi:Nuclear transcription factor Y subunit C-2 [Hordeum vulgare]|nr:Nuclear transcription factor Y subunit C-2 [Hordeum vulgare]